MHSSLKRWMWALLLSGSCFGATLFWYRSTGSLSTQTTSEKPIAYVVRVADEIQRRPATRLLWQLVSQGDPLYNGESVRTSQLGEVRIQFRDGKEIDLEPESLMVLSAAKGTISLDLLEGGLFVDSQNKGAGEEQEQLVLKSAAGSIDLSKARASITKGSGPSVDVQVLEGSAAIKDQQGNSRTIQQGAASQLGANTADRKFDITAHSPKAGDKIYLDPEGSLETFFQWAPLPKDSRVHLLMGSSRRQLKKLAEANGRDKRLSVKVNFGKNFWQLVAIDPATQKIVGQTNIMRTEWAPRYPPTVLFPFHQASVKASGLKVPIILQWQSGDLKPRVVVELSENPGLAQPILKRPVDGSESLATPPLAPGAYYWRLSAFYPDSARPFVGRINTFTITKDETKPIEAPPPPTPQPLAIQWTVPEELTRQMFVEKPTLDLSWSSSRPEEVASYRLILKDESNPSGAPMLIESQSATAKAQLARGGRYMASIEAIGKDGKILGRSDPKSFESAVLPLLKSPQWDGGGNDFVATLDGHAQLEWDRVDGAKEYIVTLLKDGKEIQKKKMVGTTLSLKDLLPGDYSAKVISVDQYGRTSTDLSTKKIVVPDRSGLKAPSLKKIKVN